MQANETTMKSRRESINAEGSHNRPTDAVGRSDARALAVRKYDGTLVATKTKQKI